MLPLGQMSEDTLAVPTRRVLLATSGQRPGMLPTSYSVQDSPSGQKIKVKKP